MRTRNLFQLGGSGVPLILLCGCVASAQGTLKCRATNPTSANLIGQLTNWVTTSDPERIAQRDTIYHIPVVPVSQLTLVTDETVCGKIIQAWAALPGGHTAATIYVVKMGSKNYAAYAPTDKAGEYSIVLIFDSKYKHVGGWTGG